MCFKTNLLGRDWWLPLSDSLLHRDTEARRTLWKREALSRKAAGDGPYGKLAAPLLMSKCNSISCTADFRAKMICYVEFCDCYLGFFSPPSPETAWAGCYEDSLSEWRMGLPREVARSFLPFSRLFFSTKPAPPQTALSPTGLQVIFLEHEHEKAAAWRRWFWAKKWQEVKS